MSLALIMVTAAGVVLLLLVLVQIVCWIGPHESFISTVILGQDKRTSTSKTFILMWTLIVAWALIALLIAGEFTQPHHCVTSTEVAKAVHKCTREVNEVYLLQVGWRHFLDAGLAGSYLILLGVPAAAGVAAKGITQAQVTGTGFKTPNTQSGPDPISRITEIFSGDDGRTDIGDFQYMIFNLLAAAYFVVQFVNPDGSGLPTMPDTLLGLTSVSAALYVGKKAVTQSQPTVTGVFPQPIQANMRFTIVGEHLTADPTSPTDNRPQVTIDGVPALNISTDGTTLTAVAPAALTGAGAPVLHRLQVKNPYNGITPTFDVQCL